MVWRKADLPHLRLLPLYRTAGASVQAVGHEMRQTRSEKSIQSPGLLCLVYNAGAQSGTHLALPPESDW
jgi:hypothetical protein